MSVVHRTKDELKAFENYLTLDQAAQYMQVSYQHIRNLIKREGLPSVKVGRHRNSPVRIKLEALEDWLINNPMA